MISVDFFECDFTKDISPTYVIIGAKYNGLWAFVKSRKRGTYEMPAGHIDNNESAYYAAGRELIEETGASKFVIECINTYSVKHNSSIKFGKLFFADILELGEIGDPDEIEELIFSSALPENLTFPEVQKALFDKLKYSQNL